MLRVDAWSDFVTSTKRRWWRVVELNGSVCVFGAGYFGGEPRIPDRTAPLPIEVSWGGRGGARWRRGRAALGERGQVHFSVACWKPRLFAAAGLRLGLRTPSEEIGSRGSTRPARGDA